MVSEMKAKIAYELHRQARRVYTRQRINIKGLDDLWHADLVEMGTHPDRRYRYILTCIDSFSKYAWAIPLLDKTAAKVTAAMRSILTQGRKPSFLQTDEGKEFYNGTFQELMQQYGIKHYSTYSTMKACLVERFNRSLKALMWRGFTARGSYKWVARLPALVYEYNNNHRHSTIGMTPAQAVENPGGVQLKLRKISDNIAVRFKVGDNVRISKVKSVFDKGYLPNWSSELFTVVKVSRTVPPTYHLEDYQGNPISGKFYTEELQRTQYPDSYLVERVLRTRGDQCYVKWLGFGAEHNSWILKTDIYPH